MYLAILGAIAIKYYKLSSSVVHSKHFSRLTPAVNSKYVRFWKTFHNITVISDDESLQHNIITAAFI